MPKTLVDIDDALLDQTADALHTSPEVMAGAWR